MLPSILRRIRWLFRKGHRETDLENEISAHIEGLVERNEAAGMSSEEARYAAQRQFGNVASIKDQAREQWRWRWLERWMTDAGFAVRSLGRARGFTLTMLTTLTVGIAVAMAAVSLTSWVLIPRWPFPQPEQLVRILIREGPVATNDVCTGVEFRAFQELTKVFSGLGAAEQLSCNVMIEGVPHVTVVMDISDGCERTFGVKPARGRGFSPEEYRAGANHVAVISENFWREKLQTSATVLGQSLVIDREAYVIIGVLSAKQMLFPGFTGDIIRPLVLKTDPAEPFAVSLYVIGRLGPGITRSQADAALSTVKMTGLPPWTDPYFAARKPALRDLLFVPTKPYWLLLAAGILLYASACLNALNLMMVRLLGRKRELGIRLALGGSRWQIARLLLVESLMLSLTAGLIVAFLWRLAFPPLATLLQGPDSVVKFYGPWWQVGGETLGISLAWSIVAGVAVGIVPVMRLLKGDLNTAIKEGGAGHGESRRMARLRQALVVLQASSAVILLVGTGLMVSSFEKIHRLELGFDRTGKVNVQVMFPRGYDPAPEARLHLFDQLTKRLEELPGVKGAAYAAEGLLGGEWQWEQLSLPDGTVKLVGGNYVGPDFDRVEGLALVKGRWLANLRGEKTDRVEAVINQTMARQMFGDRDPIGQKVPQRPYLVVGVSRDVRGDLRQPVGLHYYAPATLYPKNISTIVLHTAGDLPPEFIGTVQRTIFSVDPRLIVLSVSSIEQMINGSMWPEQFAYRTLRVLSPIALGLAVIGLFSVLACNVETRTREFGVRLALGATPGDLLRLVLRRGVGAAASGVVLGTVCAVGLTRFMQSLLFETTATEPLVYLAVAAVLMASSVLSCWIPARRAARIDPIMALRAE